MTESQCDSALFWKQKRQISVTNEATVMNYALGLLKHFWMCTKFKQGNTRKSGVLNDTSEIRRLGRSII